MNARQSPEPGLWAAPGEAKPSTSTTPMVATVSGPNRVVMVASAIHPVLGELVAIGFLLLLWVTA